MAARTAGTGSGGGINYVCILITKSYFRMPRFPTTTLLLVIVMIIVSSQLCHSGTSGLRGNALFYRKLNTARSAELDPVALAKQGTFHHFLENLFYLLMPML